MIAAVKPPAVLIVNPNAGRASHAGRRDVIDALRARFDLEAHSTTARDTGITLARDAAGSGASLVIAYGGDGHVNEVVNGLVGTDTELGIVPGGTMNVFARALGLPMDPLQAVDHLVALRDGPVRRVNLGKMDARYFTFSAGCGFDAEAAERVGRYVPTKRRMGEIFYYWSAVRVLAGSYRHRARAMKLRGPFGEVDVAMTIASNAGPYAYLFKLPIEIAPRVKLEGGVDVFALKTMRVEMLPLYAVRLLVSRNLTEHADAFYASDLDGFDVEADQPFLRHVDGEALPPARSAHFRLARDALLVRG